MIHYAKEVWVFRFIQDMQLINKVTIRNMEFRLMVDEVVEAFIGSIIYSNRKLYSSHDQFQLTKEIKNIITIKTFLDLLCMYILLQGATNLVAYL